MDSPTRKKRDVKIDFLADTNILINLLEGDKRLFPYKDRLFATSFVSEIELLGKPGTTQLEIKACKALLDDSILIPYSDEIKEIAITLKQKRRILLADALIAATSMLYNLPVLTFDKGFSKIPGVTLLMLE